jgi:TonB family protein
MRKKQKVDQARTYAHAVPMRPGTGIESRVMMFCYGISILVHLVFFGSVVFLAEPDSQPRLGQSAINVSLVSLPGPPKAAAPPATAPAPQPEAKTVAVPPKETQKAPKTPVMEAPAPEQPPVSPKPAETVSLAPKQNKPKVKRSLKKKTQNRQKMIDRAMTNVEKQVEKSQSDSVRQAIDRLKKKVAQSEAGGSQTGRTAAATPGAPAAGIPGATGSGGQRTLEITDIYKIEVAFQVERNWAFSQQVAGDNRALQASLVFRVMPSGEITDIRFTRRSGNTYFDDSAYKAIVKANPVSPHPAEIKVPYVTVPLRFTPEGLRK